MALNIKSHEADRLARALAAETGESITEAVTTALKERLERTQRSRHAIGERLSHIRATAADLAAIDDRTPEEIIGYDADGLPS